MEAGVLEDSAEEIEPEKDGARSQGQGQQAFAPVKKPTLEIAATEPSFLVLAATGRGDGELPGEGRIPGDGMSGSHAGE